MERKSEARRFHQIYEVGFPEQLDNCMDIIADKKITLVSNAGALNTPEYVKIAKELCEKHGQVIQKLLTLRATIFPALWWTKLNSRK